MGSHICQECGGTYVAAPGGWEQHIKEDGHVNAVLRKRREEREQADRDRYPTITVQRAGTGKMPSPLHGRVFYHGKAGDLELHGVRAVSTHLEVNAAQLVTVTFIGQLVVVDNEEEENKEP